MAIGMITTWRWPVPALESLREALVRYLIASSRFSVRQTSMHLPGVRKFRYAKCAIGPALLIA